MENHIIETRPLASIALNREKQGMPPEIYFVFSAVFHYLGPAFAVLLFAHVNVLGVAWLRIASAAAVFALWKRPWRLFSEINAKEKRIVVALGAVLASMNVCFYLAISRVPLGTVGTIEFLGPIIIAASGARTRRNIAALLLAVAGVFFLTRVRISGEPLGYVFAFANCAFFLLYIVLGHRIADQGGRGGVERLALAMLVAAIVVTPIGLKSAIGTFFEPRLLMAGIGVGVCSSVIPYVCDQFAMSRLSKSTFALMLALLPATACVIGLLVLRQIPSFSEIVGVCSVIGGVALRRTND
jgi:inner membrane transporter RhtA